MRITAGFSSRKRLLSGVWFIWTGPRASSAQSHSAEDNYTLCADKDAVDVRLHHTSSCPTMRWVDQHLPSAIEQQAKTKHNFIQHWYNCTENTQYGSTQTESYFLCCVSHRNISSIMLPETRQTQAAILHWIYTELYLSWAWGSGEVIPFSCFVSNLLTWKTSLVLYASAIPENY